MTGQSVCQECDPGYSCSEGSTSARPSSDKCPKGYYCPDGLTETACPEGRSSPYYYIFTVRNDVAKVMFLQVCVCPQGGSIPACLAGGIPACLVAGLQGGCYPSMHCRWYPSMPCNRSPGGYLPAPGGLLLGGACSGGCLLWGVSAPRGFCFGGCGELPLKADGYCCGRYASYWNAFLFRKQKLSI